MQGLASVASQDTFVSSPCKGKKRHPVLDAFRLYRSALRADYLVLYFDSPTLLLLAVLFRCTPFLRCQLVVVDLFLAPDAATQPRWKRALYNFVYRQVKLFLVFVRDAAFYQRHYDIKDEQLAYIPYKVNALELIERTKTYDGGYIFSGGKSRRDFQSLIDAVRGFDYPVRIVTAPAPELRLHGSTLPSEVPPNVDIHTKDTSIEYFVQQMAGARLVVIPVIRDVMSQAGIAVYLMAMAMGKCVVVSSGPGVDGILSSDQARIVSPGNVDQLREEIRTLWTDEDYRSRIARNGLTHAQRLGGTENLCRSILESLRTLNGARQPYTSRATTSPV
jgi:glycosyltransferase involved in cell wall biosynthesis